MKEITKIHVAKHLFLIEVMAKKTLQEYLKQLKTCADRDIYIDVEQRVMELLQGKLVATDAALTMEDVEEVIAQLGSPGDFSAEPTSSEDVRLSWVRKGWHRLVAGAAALAAIGILVYVGYVIWVELKWLPELYNINGHVIPELEPYKRYLAAIYYALAGLIVAVGLAALAHQLWRKSLGRQTVIACLGLMVVGAGLWYAGYHRQLTEGSAIVEYINAHRVEKELQLPDNLPSFSNLSLTAFGADVRYFPSYGKLSIQLEMIVDPQHGFPEVTPSIYVDGDTLIIDDSQSWINSDSPELPSYRLFISGPALDAASVSSLTFAYAGYQSPEKQDSFTLAITSGSGCGWGYMNTAPFAVEGDFLRTLYLKLGNDVCFNSVEASIENVTVEADQSNIVSLGRIKQLSVLDDGVCPNGGQSKVYVGAVESLLLNGQSVPVANRESGCTKVLLTP